MIHLPQPALCLVVGPGDCAGRPLTQVVQQAVDGGVNLVQLRDKAASPQEMLALARMLLALLTPWRVPLIVNDYAEIVVEAGADGLHLGQLDMDPISARRIIGDERMLGLSTKTPEQARAARDLPVDYLGAGSVFPTRTKPASATIGVDGLHRVCRAASQPVLAIGGIDARNVHLLSDAPMRGAAVVSAIASAPDPRHAAAEIRGKLSKGVK